MAAIYLISLIRFFHFVVDDAYISFVYVKYLIQTNWECISEDMDELITHGPPPGIEDLNIQKDHAGSQELMDMVVDAEE